MHEQNNVLSAISDSKIQVKNFEIEHLTNLDFTDYSLQFISLVQSHVGFHAQTPRQCLRTHAIQISVQIQIMLTNQS